MTAGVTGEGVGDRVLVDIGVTAAESVDGCGGDSRVYWWVWVTAWGIGG